MPLGLHGCNWANGETWCDVYASAEDAADAFLAERNVDKDAEWWVTNARDKNGIEEKDGKLYNHWGDYEHGEYDELFKGSPGDKPHTVAELRKYLIDGNELTLYWATRGTSFFAIADMGDEEKYWEDTDAFSMLQSLPAEIAASTGISPAFTRRMADTTRGRDIDAIFEDALGRTPLKLDGGEEELPSAADFSGVMGSQFSRATVARLGGYAPTLTLFFEKLSPS